MRLLTIKSLRNSLREPVAHHCVWTCVCTCVVRLCVRLYVYVPPARDATGEVCSVASGEGLRDVGEARRAMYFSITYEIIHCSMKS